MADYEGSWSCIERRAQTEAVALIKTPPDLSQSLGKGGVRKAWKKNTHTQRGEKDEEEETGKAREAKNTRKSLPPPLDTASAGLL